MFNFQTSKTVCYCIDVDEATIVSAINKGANSLSKIKEVTKACTGDECATKNPSGKCCSKDIKELIKKYSKVDT